MVRAGKLSKTCEPRTTDQGMSFTLTLPYLRCIQKVWAMSNRSNRFRPRFEAH